MKKVTMKDIAARAEVSVATVSYVLNNNEKEKINEETKERILGIAKELNYVPNLNARSLVKKKSGLVGVIIVRDYETERPWKKNFYSSYIHALERQLDKEGYHLLITNTPLTKPDLDIVLQRELEAVFVVDVGQEFFYQISNRFTVPIIVVDSIINDNLFYKVLPDFQDSINRAIESIGDKETYLITEKFNNAEVMKTIINEFKKKSDNIYVMESKEGLKEFLKGRENQKGIIINEYIALMAERYVDYHNLTVISTCGDLYLLPKNTEILEFNVVRKAEKSMELIRELLEHRYRGDKYLILKAE